MRYPGKLGLAAAVLCLSASCGSSTAPEPPPGPAPAEPAPAWTPEPNVPTTADLLAVWGRSADDVYAVGWDGTILHYDGLTWRRETTTSTVPLTAVHGRPWPDATEPPLGVPTTVAVGWSGTILERGADGVWTAAARTSSATEDLFGVSVGAEDSALAVGDRGRVLGWDGVAWSTVDFSVPGEFSGEPIRPKGVLKGVWSIDGRRYYITGSGGASYRSGGGYERFAALDTRVSVPLRGVWGAANDDVYAVGLDALVLRFSGRWRRESGEDVDALPRTFLFGISGATPQDITAVGWGGVVIRRRDGRWAQELSGVETDLRSVWVDPETETAFAVGASGLILSRPPPANAP